MSFGVGVFSHTLFSCVKLCCSGLITYIRFIVVSSRRKRRIVSLDQMFEKRFFVVECLFVSHWHFA